MKKHRTWEEVAKILVEVYGSYLDEEEPFVVCPECEEPIYECDYDGSDGEFDDGVLCPICGFTDGE